METTTLFTYDFLYRCAGNWKTYFTISLPKEMQVGDEITMEELGFDDAESFIIEYVGNYDEKYDHNILEMVEIATENTAPDLVITQLKEDGEISV